MKKFIRLHKEGYDPIEERPVYRVGVYEALPNGCAPTTVRYKTALKIVDEELEIFPKSEAWQAVRSYLVEYKRLPLYI